MAKINNEKHFLYIAKSTWEEAVLRPILVNLQLYIGRKKAVHVMESASDVMPGQC